MKDIILNDYNLVRVAAVSPKLEVANPSFNTNQILELLKNKELNNSHFILFPELSISSYTCGDLFLDRTLIDSSLKNLESIVRFSSKISNTIFVGCPIEVDSILYNCAVVIQKGEILGIIPKSFLCNYSEYYEERWFKSGLGITAQSITIFQKQVPFGTDLVFHNKLASFAVEICEDLWAFKPPSIDYSINGAEIIFNLSASNEVLGKSQYRKELVKTQSSRLIGAYVYSSSGPNESSTDLVFSSHKLIALNGKLLKESNRFDFENDFIISDIDMDIIKAERIKNKTFANSLKSPIRKIEFEIAKLKSNELHVEISKNPFIPNIENREEVCNEIIEIQSTGLAKRLKHINAKTVILGLSGGLDSTLALLVCVKTFQKLELDLQGIIAVIMPGPASSKRTQKNAENLAKELGVSYKIININKAVDLHLDLIEHNKIDFDITYENAQARKRTQILMDIANKENGILVGTGDLSELALGWCTFNGDHMSMYGVNSGVPKTLIKFLIMNQSKISESKKVKKILDDILVTPISPELIPMEKGIQETEKSIGSYHLHDFFIYNFLKYRYTPKKLFLFAIFVYKDEYNYNFILECLTIFLKRFFANQFKRSTLPDGPKVGSINLSPRGDWRMPSDASVNEWIKSLNEIKI